ncbi:hypothetical protein E2C01_080469 [Portunus trituberculatus]|uniref:Uncharacterized protein n=1 Tax=Portunus trituberculatus TaxID=210409 RepID=A0A5B7ITC7_PORTR|nr:hypothetical protein [Portunus trituberculatus]
MEGVAATVFASMKTKVKAKTLAGRHERIKSTLLGTPAKESRPGRSEWLSVCLAGDVVALVYVAVTCYRPVTS